MQGVITAQSLLKTTGILKASPDATLGSVLPKLSRSHDAIFIFDPDEQFLGVVNPYFVLFKKNFPPETKIKRCLYHPPKLRLATPFWEIASCMIASRLYFLPVFDDEEFVGVISVNRLFAEIEKQKPLIKNLALPTKRDVVTILQTDSAESAFKLLRKNKLSRVPVVNKVGRLVGMVTRYMLHTALAQPRKGQASGARRGDKRKRLDQKLSKYYKNQVPTVLSNVSGRELFCKMLAVGTSSITVVNAKRIPVGIVSTQDVLRELAQLKPQPQPTVGITMPPKFNGADVARDMVEQLVALVHDRKKVASADFTLKTNRNPKGKPVEYRAHIGMQLYKGKNYSAHAQNRNWKTAVQEIENKLRRQVFDS